MFNHCVWYSIHRDHKICKLIGKLSAIFNSCFFQGHITIASRLTFDDANNEYVKQCTLVKPWFKLVGIPYQTNVENFYTIQHHCEMYGVKGLGDFHVSLAYRLNRPFTDEDLETVADLIPIDSIHSTDIYISLNDCRSLMPIHWKQLKRCIV